MKHIRFLSLILLIALALTACETWIPAIGTPETETETESEVATESESEAETEPAEPKKRVAITYDDGPAFDNDTVQRLTYKLVDEFAKYGGTATFFVLGNRINSTTGKAIQYAHERGFEFAIHGFRYQ